jgi:hypothetical protein
MLHNELIIKDAPDFNFIILENTANKPDLKAVQWDSKHARLRSVGEVGTLLDMHILMSKSLDIIAPIGTPSEHSTGQPMYAQSGIFFAPDFPDFLLPLDNPKYNAPPGVVSSVITWGTVRKEPGTMSGKPFRGTQEIKPRVREFLAVFGDYEKQWIIGNDKSDLEGFGELTGYVQTSAQAFDNLVQYNIWSRSNYEVEELTEWFEEYMDSYRGMFREAGIVELVFDRRVRDDTLVQMKNSYHVRSVLYYVRTERVRIKSITPIKRVDLKINVNDLRRVSSTLSDHIIDTNLYDRILKKWHQ